MARVQAVGPIMTATTPRTRKAKGREFQTWVADQIRATLICHEDDVKPVLMSGAGVDIQISPAMRERFPFSIECKRTESLNVWQAFKQARVNAYPATHPVLVAKSNRLEPLAVIPFSLFLAMVEEIDRGRGGR